MPDQIADIHHITRGEGPGLLLLHPVGLDRSFWGPLIDQAAQDLKFHAVDLPGHGGSPLLGPDAPIGDCAEAIATFADQSDAGRVALVGFGGMNSQEITIRHPVLVDRLIVGACPSRIPPEARESIRARGASALQNEVASLVPESLERWFSKDLLNQAAVEAVSNRLLTGSAEGWAAGWNAISGFDALERLATITDRSLIIAGEKDVGASVSAVKSIADAISDAEFIVLQETPHMMQIEFGNRFTAAVTYFLPR